MRMIMEMPDLKLFELTQMIEGMFPRRREREEEKRRGWGGGGGGGGRKRREKEEEIKPPNASYIQF